MREINFRGKSPDGHWIEGDLIHKALTVHSRIVDYGIAKLGCYPVEVIPETVGEFTGLKDKNGKDIFGGSKLYIDDVYLGYIRWNDGAFHIFDVSTNCLSNPLVQERAKRLEIRGNIHDNPEILP